MLNFLTGNKFDLNVFTCCNGVYKNFIPLFILSNLYHNEKTFVEIGVDYDDVSNTESMNFLKTKFKNKFLIREVNFEKYKVGKREIKPIPNLIRFINKPLFVTEYVYISDVDIITLDKNILSKHIKNMEKYSLPYSNIVREYEPNQVNKRLTGLHLSKFKNYYPIPDYTDLFDKSLYSHDEVFLYELMYKKHGKPNEETKFRPVHGIHVSPNRTPDGDVNWGINTWRNEWLTFRNSDIFLELEPLLTDFLKEQINLIDNYIKK
ncbi:MAG: hypothetical protein RLZ10_244 [Bacteroidota bacterium]|jgi:hypothetical protein